MNRCKTCKHWVPYTKKYPNSFNNSAKSGGFCESEKFTEDEGYKDDMLVYSYSEGGGFLAGPEFGCIHHEELVK